MCSHEQLYGGIVKRIRERTRSTLYGERDSWIKESGFYAVATDSKIELHPYSYYVYAFIEDGVWFIYTTARQGSVYIASSPVSLEVALRNAASAVCKMAQPGHVRYLPLGKQSIKIATELHLLANVVAVDPQPEMDVNPKPPMMHLVEPHALLIRQGGLTRSEALQTVRRFKRSR